MEIKVNIEPNEVDSPIRFATAIIERCMDINNFNPDRLKENYMYLCEVNEHIETFLRHYNYHVYEEENNDR